MSKSLKTILLVLLLIAMGCALLTVYQLQSLPKKSENLTSTTVPTLAPTQNQIRLKGVSLSPLSYAKNDFSTFWQTASQSGNTVMWAGDWLDLTKDNLSTAQTVIELNKSYQLTPLIIVGYYNQGEGKLNRPLTDELKQQYLQSAVQLVSDKNLQYFGMGVEVNIMYSKSPAEYQDFVKFYQEVYSAIKKQSPSTQVFTVFQLETIKGCIFWQTGSCNQQNSQWQLLDDFKSDLTVFTSYPSLIYKNPQDLPLDYYQEIKQHTKQKIAFTELGWPTTDRPNGWESSIDEQKEFMQIFKKLSVELELQVVIWSFLYDQKDVAQPFDQMGLWDQTNNAKPAYLVWQELQLN